MLIKHFSVSLKKFARKLLSQKFIFCPDNVKNYYRLKFNKKKTDYNYVLEDFRRRKKKKKYFKTKAHQRVSPLRVVKFINKSLLRRSKKEDYIKRGLKKHKIIKVSIKKKPKKLVFLKLKRFKKIKKRRVRLPVLKLKRKEVLSVKLKDSDQLKANRLITRFRNLFAKKGKLYKSELLFSKVRYLIKIALKKKKGKKTRCLIRFKKTKTLVNKVFFKVLSSARPIICLKLSSKKKTLL